MLCALSPTSIRCRYYGVFCVAFARASAGKAFGGRFAHSSRTTHNVDSRSVPHHGATMTQREDKWPKATGAVMRTLGVPEWKINHALRSGKIDPPPELFCGKRMWLPHHVESAAKALGKLTPSLKRSLDRAAARAE